MYVDLDSGTVSLTLQVRRMGSFFNLPSDQLLGYPKFTSFQQRKDYVRAQILESQEVKKRVRQLIARTTTHITVGHTEKEVLEDDSFDHHGVHLIDIRGTSPHAQRTQEKPESSFVPKHDVSTTNLHHVQEPKMGSQNFLDHVYQLQKESEPSVGVNSNLFPEKSDYACARVCGIPSGSLEQPTGRDNCYLGPLFAWSNPLHKPYVVSGYRFPSDGQAPAADVLSRQSRPHTPLPLASESKSHLPDQLRQLEITFVGDKTARFYPAEGDLIVCKPGVSMCFGSTGYLITYKGPSTHRFEHGELVLRVGGQTCTEAGLSKYSSKPSTRNLELYRYNMDGKWTYLGSQVETESCRNDIVMNYSISPGKYVKVGGRIISLGKFKPLIPRKGDVIIKRDAWQENFRHEENFWQSMVKWHGGQQIRWAPEDLLLRLFVDSQEHNNRLSTNSSNLADSVRIPDLEPGDHTECLPHGPCPVTHEPPFPGYAELYEIRLTNKETNSQWIYWGRTGQICNRDSQIENVDPFLILYVNNDAVCDPVYDPTSSESDSINRDKSP